MENSVYTRLKAEHDKRTAALFEKKTENTKEISQLEKELAEQLQVDAARKRLIEREIDESIVVRDNAQADLKRQELATVGRETREIQQRITELREQNNTIDAKAIVVADAVFNEMIGPVECEVREQWRKLLNMLDDAFNGVQSYKGMTRTHFSYSQTRERFGLFSWGERKDVQLRDRIERWI